MLKKSFENSLLIITLVFFVASCTSPTQEGAAESGEVLSREIHEESLYQLTGEWHSHKGDTLRLQSLQGKLPVMVMLFTHCPFACPRIVANVKEIEEQLPADSQDDVVFVLVSFDTERDNPERLSAFAREMDLGENWLLLHGNEQDVRELSMVLGVNYKKQPGGDFAHSNLITLLDKKGRIAESVEGLGGNPKSIIAKITDM